MGEQEPLSRLSFYTDRGLEIKVENVPKTPAQAVEGARTALADQGYVIYTDPVTGAESLIYAERMVAVFAVHEQEQE